MAVAAADAHSGTGGIGRLRAAQSHRFQSELGLWCDEVLFAGGLAGVVADRVKGECLDE
jgi:hypothetical protein